MKYRFNSAEDGGLVLTAVGGVIYSGITMRKDY